MTVPLRDTVDPERIQCFFGTATPQSFTLNFPEGSFPVDQVDTTKPCMITFDLGEETVSVAAEISALKDLQTLELTALESFTHTQTRNFFRVDATTRVAASSMIPEGLGREGESWRLLGDTIDLSGSGLLCAFGESLEKGTKVRIELTLPSADMSTIKAFGHVVRCRKIEEGLYHVALHFDMIDSESQDKIMACCFELQRRYLRMRVSLQQPETNK